MKVLYISRLFIVVTIGVFLLSGCAINKPKGPLYSPYNKQNDGKALVYVYRPLGESFGYDRTYYLMHDGNLISDLKHGGYFSFEVSPGTVYLVSDVNASIRHKLNLLAYALEAGNKKDAALIKFNVKAGNTYFIRFKPITHATYFEPTLKLVSKEESLDEIVKCKLIINKDLKD